MHLYYVGGGPGPWPGGEDQPAVVTICGLPWSKVLGEWWFVVHASDLGHRALHPWVTHTHIGTTCPVQTCPPQEQC
jgi:hypothetical protein